MWRQLLIAALVFVAKGDAKRCIPRYFGTDSIVCVCNATYCDNAPPADPAALDNGDLLWYTTTKAGLRMSLSSAKFGDCLSSPDATLEINTEKRFQTILGFGGAFTDSAGININKLSPVTQKQLIRAYFDPTHGSGYTLGRVPIGGTDFSVRPYTLDDVDDDAQLKYFALAPEDHKYKIPFMQQAVKLNHKTKFFSEAWSAPAWMKTNHKLTGFGFLKKEYYQVYANYIMKFLEAYKQYDLGIWAITTGNEPSNAFVPFSPLQTMGWTPETAADWVGNFMGPTIAMSKLNGTQIMALDDNRNVLPWWLKQFYANPKAKKYTAGTAVHWYLDSITSPARLDETHDAFPDKFILMTEACTGFSPLDKQKVLLGSWDRGVAYMSSIIQYMNNWAVGWVDWNLALDKQGGPNWIKNNVDSPIIVNPETDEFFKQPMYYALQHFSKFVVRGSVKIADTDDVRHDVNSAAFVTPAKDTVVVLNNRSNQSKNLNLKDLKRGSICLELPPNSFSTIIYKQ